MFCAINRLRRPLGCSGTVALEFGLVGGLFFLLVLAVMDLGRFYLTVHSLHTVVGAAMRAAIVNPALSGCTAPAAQVAAQAPFLEASQLTLCVTQALSSGVTTITVNASYNFAFVLPSWTNASGTLTDSTTASF